MISVEEALNLVEKNVKRATPKKVSLKDVLGLIIADDIVSPIDMPPFNQSAMDGYAINFKEEIETYLLKGEIQAGNTGIYELLPGEAVRIFTGAAVPESATSVIRQEDATVNGNQVVFDPIVNGANIRPKAEQIKSGDIALQAGKEINPATIGYLATLGITEVSVFPRPKISILTTGNELVKPGSDLSHGQIYESNSSMLESAFHYYGFRNIIHNTIRDDLKSTEIAISEALETSDIMVISGGVSVGDYDFVSEALRKNDVTQIFHRVKQKPGKPLLFATLGNKLIFGLPGNPAAALTSFYLYILPSLNKLTGGDFYGCGKTELPLSETYARKGNRTEFLKAFATEEEVMVLDGQSSAMLGSFAQANALVVIPEQKEVIEKGEFVTVLPL